MRFKIGQDALDKFAGQLRLAGNGGAAFLATSGVVSTSWKAMALGAVTWVVFQALALLVSSVHLDDSS